MPKIQARSLGWEDCLEEGVETHSSFLAWRIPWIEEPGGLWPRGLPRLEHNWNDLACINLGTELLSHILIPWGFPGGASSKESACQCRRCNGLGLDTWVGKIPWRRKCQPALVFFLGKIPWTEEPGGLQFMELQRIRHDWAESTHTHTLILCLSFWKTARLFSTVAAPFPISTSNVWGSQFLHILANNVFFNIFYYSHPRGCE